MTPFSRVLGFVVWLGLLLGFAAQAATNALCPPEPWTQGDLVNLKTQNWKIHDTDKRNNLAIALITCLGDVDPNLRDGIAFEALSTWMRGGALSKETLQILRKSLIATLEAGVANGEGFAKPFAALVLAEVARTDRISQWMETADRNDLVNTAIAYMRGIRDYRGFSQTQGWRHGVAHASDLLMQLAMLPSTTGRQLQDIADAVQSQVAANGEHFYVYGESARLARPILLSARRPEVDALWWAAYLKQLVAPAPLASWNQAFDSNSGLARLHNTKAFILVLYAAANESDHPGTRVALLGPLREALQALP